MKKQQHLAYSFGFDETKPPNVQYSRKITQVSKVESVLN